MNEQKSNVNKNKEYSDNGDYEYKWKNKKNYPMVLELFKLIKHSISNNITLFYNKKYIAVGFFEKNQAEGFVRFTPSNDDFLIRLKIPQSIEIDENIKNAGLKLGKYQEDFGGYYRIYLSNNDISNRKNILIELIKIAYLKYRM